MSRTDEAHESAIEDLHNCNAQQNSQPTQKTKKLRLSEPDDFEEFAISKQYSSFDEFKKKNFDVKNDACRSLASTQKITKSKKTNVTKQKRKKRGAIESADSLSRKKKKTQKSTMESVHSSTKMKKKSKKSNKKKFLANLSLKQKESKFIEGDEQQIKNEQSKEFSTNKESPRKLLSKVLSNSKRISQDEEMNEDEENFFPNEYLVSEKLDSENDDQDEKQENFENSLRKKKFSLSLFRTIKSSEKVLSNSKENKFAKEEKIKEKQENDFLEKCLSVDEEVSTKKVFSKNKEMEEMNENEVNLEESKVAKCSQWVENNNFKSSSQESSTDEEKTASEIIPDSDIDDVSISGIIEDSN